MENIQKGTAIKKYSLNTDTEYSRKIKWISKKSSYINYLIKENKFS